MTLIRILAVLLFLSAVNLALMIPGGFVENRVFPGYPVAVLVAFNIFLTGLGLGSLMLGVRVWRSGGAGGWGALAGLGYLAVYLLDLAHIFPVAEAQMSSLLITLEEIGTLLGLMLVAAGLRVEVLGKGSAQDGGMALPRGLLVCMAILSVIIILFATWSAMHLA